ATESNAQIGFVQVHELIGFTALQREFPDLPTGRSLTLLVVEVNFQNVDGPWAVPRGEELANKQVTYLPQTRTPTTFSEHAKWVSWYLAGRTWSAIPDAPSVL